MKSKFWQGTLFGAFVTTVILVGMAIYTVEAARNDLVNQLAVVDTTDATSTTSAPLKTAGGLAVAEQAFIAQSIQGTGRAVLHGQNERFEDTTGNLDVELFRASVPGSALNSETADIFGARVALTVYNGRDTFNTNYAWGTAESWFMGGGAKRAFTSDFFAAHAAKSLTTYAETKFDSADSGEADGTVNNSTATLVLQVSTDGGTVFADADGTQSTATGPFIYRVVARLGRDSADVRFFTLAYRADVVFNGSVTFPSTTMVEG